MSEEVAEPPPLSSLPGLKIEPKTEPGEGSQSPEPNCAICLEGFNNKSFTNSCLHEFCYPCLKEWSKIKPECPLCKQRFQTIIHNVRSPQDYDEYQVEDNNNPFNVFLNLTAATTRFPYSNTLDFRERMHERDLFPGNTNISSMLLVRPTRDLIRHDSSYLTVRYLNEYSANVTHRRDVYRHNLWRRPINSSRVRESSPEFYRLNPAQTHRLVPWLFRELHVLLDVTLDPNELMNVILQLIRLYPIWSRRFREVLLPAMGEHTDHFLHEFYHFAISPHDIIAYDNVAEYDPPGRPARCIPLRLNYSSESDDSDVEVVQPLRPKILTVMENHCGLDLTNRAGPSSGAVYNVDTDRIKNNDVIIEISDTSSSDSEVEIIHVRPPTPVVITIDSTESEELEVTNIDLCEGEGERETWTPMPSSSRESTPPMPCLRPVNGVRTRSFRKRPYRLRTSSTSSSSTSSSSLTSSSSSSSSDSDYRHNRSSHRNKKRKRAVRQRKVKPKKRSKKSQPKIYSSSDEGYAR